MATRHRHHTSPRRQVLHVHPLTDYYHRWRGLNISQGDLPYHVELLSDLSPEEYVVNETDKDSSLYGMSAVSSQEIWLRSSWR